MAEISEEPPCPKRTKLTDPAADGHGVTPLTVKVQGQEEHLTCDLSEEAKAQALYMAALSHLDEAATAFTKLVGTHEMSTAVRGKVSWGDHVNTHHPPPPSKPLSTTVTITTTHHQVPRDPRAPE